MAADLGLVTHPAQRHAHELAAGRFRDRLAKRGLADAGRADQAQNRSGQLIGALLHGEIFDDPLLDLFQAIVIGVEDLLGQLEIFLDLALFAPRDREQPVEIVAHDRRFRRHRRHLAELLEFVRRFLAGLFRELGLLDLVFQLLQLVATFFVAELLLDRLHLFVEVVLALGLLHLPLDAGPDALFDLKNGNLAFHQAEHFFQALGDGRRLQDVLFVRNLDGEMRSHGVGELGVILYLLDHANHLRRHFLVQLHVIFEFIDDRARHGFRFDAVTHVVGKRGRVGFVVVDPIGVFENLCSRRTLDQHLHGAVGQLQQLQHAGQRPDFEN